MGLLDEIRGMGYSVRAVDPVKVQDAGCLNDSELDALREDEMDEIASKTAAEWAAEADHHRREIKRLTTEVARDRRGGQWTINLRRAKDNLWACEEYAREAAEREAAS